MRPISYVTGADLARHGAASGGKGVALGEGGRGKGARGCVGRGSTRNRALGASAKRRGEGIGGGGGALGNQEDQADHANPTALTTQELGRDGGLELSSGQDRARQKTARKGRSPEGPPLVGEPAVLPEGIGGNKPHCCG